MIVFYAMIVKAARLFGCCCCCRRCCERVAVVDVDVVSSVVKAAL
jgi:hypothetical protein